MNALIQYSSRILAYILLTTSLTKGIQKTIKENDHNQKIMAALNVFTTE